ncbi:hypothetical protein [Bacillus sp. FJAT-42315]|uniref:hypothetical protein n=1 Tax=Bacillus sp. FJAT-42315 TaxID=2014077 RepID=UPI000C23A0F3|nr:hypothetical protein [Bacillus sp. FJAT-42315]
METKSKSQFSSQMSEKIWGHRFREGQRGPEYTLEFLNVMAGTDYQLGHKFYERKRMEQFRSFVFEGSKEGARSKDGSASFVSFDEHKKQELLHALGIDHSELEDLQMFFKNLSIQMTTPTGKLLDRSWYATMLFPLHESLLFFELRANKKTNKTAFERNFFARGGELYFLMLTYGTEHSPKLREAIEMKLKNMMRQNKSVTGVVERISSQLEDDYEIDLNNPKNPATLIKDPSLDGIISNYENREYPKLPDMDLELFKHMAEELRALLELNIDLYEMFGLMTSLICFQLHRYMIYQSERVTKESNFYFIDCLDGQDPQVKRLAQDSYRRHETSVRDSFDSFTKENLKTLLPLGEEISKLRHWKEAAEQSTETKDVDKYSAFLNDIEFGAAHATKKNALIKALKNSNEEQAVKLLEHKIIEFSQDELNKKQLPIVRTVARDGGFVTMGPGVRGRYIMTDNFLCTLVYATLGKVEKMDFHDFMSVLYDKYKIVIGTEEAKKSGLYEREGVNLRYFQHNENKLRQKLKQNGLLQEYSDATALIRNPYINKGESKYGLHNINR